MFTEQQQAIIDQAISIIESSFKREDNNVITTTDHASDLCRLKIGCEHDEKFGVLFLDNRHRLIEFKVLFTGTINAASVYPRSVVRECLALNAAAVILTHNHPSGITEPSQSDEKITQRLSQALELIDVRVIDHIIVSQKMTTSFVQRGLL